MENEQVEKKDAIRILLVDEKRESRSFFSGFLKASPLFTATTAANTLIAFEILEAESHEIHFILFDWKMKEVPGNIFAQQVRQNPSFDHIDFIVYSQILTDDDNFLIAELDIYHTFPKIINGKSFMLKMEEIRNSYISLSAVHKKLKNLEHAIHTENLALCNEIMQDAQVAEEINTNPRFFYLGGEIHMLKNQYGEAIDFFQSHIKDDSKNNAMLTLKAMSSLGKALCFAGRFEEALMIFERLEAKSSKNLSHKCMAGEALLGLNKNYMAEEKFHEVIELHPKDTDALMGLGKVNSVAGKHEVAKSFFDKIQGDFESKHLASFYNNKGVSLVKQHKYDEAISFYKNAMQYFQKYRGHINFNLGLAYFKKGEIKDASNYFQEALASDEFDLIPEKKLLLELQAKGVAKFEEEYSSKLEKKKKE
ncbi:tetratricopeptide repeat protein [Fluviispira multicolorata]|uniref:Tetratricopeptide repeat protein n=1 Tax=Fluviispira multicolorata TaxID=2654512 RepID=A0A833JE88_9BACT|nr:tetratricopeptide repeat protein [Fluviispira multicolorata]KAB8031937.1 tetratricopeptide repeat protein [Fluviispira multicolorata]